MTANLIVAAVGNAMVLSGRYTVRVPRPLTLAPDWAIIRAIFRFGLPTGLQGIAMNVGASCCCGTSDSSGTAPSPGRLRGRLLGTVLADHLDVGRPDGAAAAVAGQNLGADNPIGHRGRLGVAPRIGLGVAAVVGLAFVTVPSVPARRFGMREPHVLEIGTRLLRVPGRLGLLRHRRAGLQRRAAGHRRTRAHLHLAGQPVRRATGFLRRDGGVARAACVGHLDWPSCLGHVLPGARWASCGSARASGGRSLSEIATPQVRA